MLAILKLSNK